MTEHARKGPLVAAGTLIGAGMGGFIDGIALHQIAQWHNMLSSRFPPTDLPSMKFNMIWDGIFHALTWTVTAIGIGLLFHAAREPRNTWSGRSFVGALLFGWGTFNVVEGLIDHHLFGLHHVRPGPHQSAWDLAFIGFGALLVASGWSLIRSRGESPRPRSAPHAFGNGPLTASHEPPVLGE